MVYTTSPILLQSEASDIGVSGPSSIDSHDLSIHAKRLQDDSPSDKLTKRNKGRTNIKTWNEARVLHEVKGEKERDSSYYKI